MPIGDGTNFDKPGCMSRVGKGFDFSEREERLLAENAKLSAEIEQLTKMLETAREAIAQAPEDAFGGVGPAHDHSGYWIRDELVDRITKVLPTKDSDETPLTQANVIAWVRRAFGEACATDTDERGSRLVEEAIEAAQACGVGREKIDAIADRVYSRPVGRLPQEIGGTAITLYALAACVDANWQAEALKEWRRICSLPQSYWDRKHAEKHAAGTALPVPSVPEQGNE